MFQASSSARWAASVSALTILLTGFGAPVAVASEPVQPPSGIYVSTRATLAAVSWAGGSEGPYVVELDTDPTFATPARTETDLEALVLTALAPETTYYVRVSSEASGTTSAATSFTTPVAPFGEAAPTVELDSLTSTSIAPRWNPAEADGSRYQVELSASEDFAKVRNRVLAETTTTFAKLDVDTNYFVRVRLVDAHEEPLSDWSITQSRTPAASLPLRVGSFNVLKSVEKNWSERRPVVARTIEDEQVDVVGLQEATRARVGNGARQFDDLMRELGDGWAMVNRDDALGGDRIVYNPATVEVVSEGHQPLAGSNTLGVQRHVSWAVFRQKANGKQFVFVNTHFVPQKGAREKRASAARQLVAAVKAANPDNLPVVIVGDFNSYALRRSGNSVYQTILDSGVRDPLRGDVGDPGTAKKRIQAALKTFNDYQRKPRWDADAPMSDYVFVSPMRVAEWETVARLDRSKRFIGTIPSDHNMLRLTVYLP